MDFMQIPTHESLFLASPRQPLIVSEISSLSDLSEQSETGGRVRSLADVFAVVEGSAMQRQMAAGLPQLPHQHAELSRHHSLTETSDALEQLNTKVGFGAEGGKPVVGDSAGGSAMGQLFAALFAVFMATTDTVSMGAVLFPGAGSEVKQQGIRMGLLTMALTNILLAAMSRIPHGVGSLTDTVVPILATFFARAGGAENVETAMVAISLLTVLTGLATYAAGRVGIGEYVRACPYAVFGGFIAGTGAQLIEFGLNMMLPAFSSLLSLSSWSALLTQEGALMCGPGFAAAAFVFVCQRFYPSADSFLLPVMVLVMVVIFYVGLNTLGFTLEEARLAGWLFDTEIPEHVDFLKVWTFGWDRCCVRWDKIFCSDFLLTFISLFCVSFLTTVKNVYGTNEFTRSTADIDHELRVSGLVNVACGAVGGCPSGLVMSFSVTAHTLGARGKLFSWMLAVLSVTLFVFGDYVVAVLPKMVPACIVLWIGMVLLMFYAWDPIGTISGANYAIIMLMIVIDLWLGCGPMIVIGLFLSLLITVGDMMALPAVRSVYNLSAVRSDVLRPARQNNVLSSSGKRALVLQLEAGLLNFSNAFKVMDQVEKAIVHIEFLLIDWSLVHGICDSAVNTIKELLRLAETQGFIVVFAAANRHVEAALARAGIALDTSVNEQGPVAAAAAMVRRRREGSRVVLVRDCESEGHCIESMVLAMEFVEECLLEWADTKQGRHRADSIRSALLTAQDEPHYRELVRVVPVEHPAFAAVLDMHTWLSCLHMRRYSAARLQSVADALEVSVYSQGDVIYAFNNEGVMDSPGHGVQLAKTASDPPPLLWLLAGEVEHCWNSFHYEELGLSTLERGGLRRNVRLEKASLALEGVHQCLGPFRTTASFFGAMGHVGRLTAMRAGTRVAVLSRERYDLLLCEHPAAADLLSVYLAKKQFVDLARFQQPLGPTVWRRSVT